jgi:phosphoglycolate phosphatase-like HAD superfamily hydrolase
MKYYIFDFDGVLADSWDLLVRFIQTWRNLTRLDAEQFLHDYFLEPRHDKTSGMDELAKAKQQQLLHDISSHYGSEIFPLFQGFIDELAKIKDAKMAVVSSGPTRTVKKTLSQVSLDFTHILCFDDHHSKEENIALICKDWGVDPSDIYYFTDTLADYLELKNYLNSAKIIGCSWGVHGFRTLSREIPTTQILTNFSQIHSLLDINK